MSDMPEHKTVEQLEEELATVRRERDGFKEMYEFQLDTIKQLSQERGEALAEVEQLRGELEKQGWHRTDTDPDPDPVEQLLLHIKNRHSEEYGLPMNQRAGADVSTEVHGDWYDKLIRLASEALGEPL